MGSEKAMRSEQLPHVRSSFLILLVMLLLFQIEPGDAENTASDRIELGSSLTGNQTRISKSQLFKFGFFHLNHDNVKIWYVGIWYAQTAEQTIVWVANMEQPLENASSVLNLTEDGRLLLSYRGRALWSTKGNGKKPSSAVITDAGNLVVLSATNNSEIVWQSFDHLQNTMMPHMKISNKQRLSSWRSPWDPRPGSYSLQMNPNGTIQFVMMWKNETIYWDDGVWNGKYFSKESNMPVDGWSTIYSYFSNGSYKDFTVSAPQGVRGVMDKSGQLRLYEMLENKEWNMIWQRPLTQCEAYAVCGPYGLCNNNNVQSCNCVSGFVARDSGEWDSQQWSSGCVRKTSLRCSTDAANETTTDGFVELSGTSMPPHGVVVYKLGPKKCQAACLSNCSCTAYAYHANRTSQSCVMWFGELLNLYDTSNGISLFLRLDAADVPHTSNSIKKTTVAGVVGGLVAILAFLLFFLWCCSERPVLSAIDCVPVGLTVFTYKELQSATKNFSERLGGGGFGSVFKGTLADGSLVAVKKLEGVNQGEKQFSMEVSTIGVTQHVNLIRLRGFCAERSLRMLVYEYMPNGSLTSLLFKKSTRDGEQQKLLDWKTRFGIAVGTVRGIVYLHEKCKDCIIHCDIKPDNILVDSSFCPKVADFGMAKLLGREYNKVLTTMRGTRGYLAPEWISGLPITVKADVYSFGMTLLEIIAGRRILDKVSESGELFFPALALSQISSGNAMEVLDKKLLNDADAEQVQRAAIAVGWCIQDDEDARPSMSKVLQILEGIVELPALPPVPPSLRTCDESPVVFFWDQDQDSSGGC